MREVAKHFWKAALVGLLSLRTFSKEVMKRVGFRKAPQSMREVAKRFWKAALVGLLSL
jgi:hypothetical protein